MDKQLVKNFWDTASCGEEFYLENCEEDGYLKQLKLRYHLEPYILDFAQFDQYRNKKVLEIGVGLGADHQKFAEAGAKLTGVDLTPRAIEHVKKRFAQLNLVSDLRIADAEQLPFDSQYFDMVYSWGVLHHTPDTQAAIDEIYRVLKPNGEAKIMLYHKYSIYSFLLWVKCALLRGKPWMPLKKVLAENLESYGTQAFSVKEVKKLFSKFSKVITQVVLTHGDLLSSDVGRQQYSKFGIMLKKIWPRKLLLTFFKSSGFFILITVEK
jgi:ubiquinone/menaquinone biosynthesis C-methylase UbiE